MRMQAAYQYTLFFFMLCLNTVDIKTSSIVFPLHPFNKADWLRCCFIKGIDQLPI